MHKPRCIAYKNTINPSRWKAVMFYSRISIESSWYIVWKYSAIISRIRDRFVFHIVQMLHNDLRQDISM